MRPKLPTKASKANQRKRQPESRSERPPGAATSKWEWVTGVLGLLLVLGTVGFIAYDGLDGDPSVPDVTIEHIATWRPFSLLTLRYDTAGVEDWLWTYRLDSIGEGTRFTVSVADPGASHWERVGTPITDTMDLLIPQLGNAVEEAWAARLKKLGA